MDAVRPASLRSLLLPIAAFAVVLAVATILGAWADDHRLPVDWDDSAHIHQVHHDARAFTDDGPVGLARALWGQKRYAPPGYRLLVLPVSLTFGPEVLHLKIWLILNLLFCFGLLAHAAWMLSGSDDPERRRSAACLTLLAVSISPIILRAGMRLYTEPALYFGTAVSAYFLVRLTLAEKRRWLDVVGLGCGLAAGSLAKLTFAGVLGPMMLTACALGLFRKDRGGPSFASLMMSTALAILLIAPLYFMNFGAYLSYAGGVTRQGVVPTWGRMLEYYVAGVTGPVQWVFVFAFFVALAVHLVRRRGFDLGFDGRQNAALLILAAGYFPLVMLQFAAHHVNVKYSTPSYMVGTIALGAVASRLGFARFPGMLLPVLGAAGQIVLLVWPWLGSPAPEKHQEILLRDVLSVAHRMDQWDWEVVYPIAEQQGLLHGTEKARVAYLGYGRAFNRKQIEYPWIVRGEKVAVDELFTTAHEPLPAGEMDEVLRDAHVVLTVPFYTFGEFAARNQANADLAERLKADPRFEGPQILSFGDAEHEQVYLYRRPRPGG